TCWVDIDDSWFAQEGTTKRATRYVLVSVRYQTSAACRRELACAPSGGRCARAFHHGRVRPARREGRDGRRRPGHDGQGRLEARRAEAAPPGGWPGAGGFRRSDRRRLHALREVRGQAEGVWQEPLARGGRAGQGLAD